MTFVVVAVLALALVPIYFGRQANEGLTEISDILDPARLLGTRLSLVQARQMSAFQAFLLTGSPTFRQRYLSTLDSEREIYEQLTALVMGMNLDVRKRLVDLSDISNTWHLGHQEAMKDEEDRLAMAAQFADEQSRYQALQEATLELETAIQNEVEGGRQRIELQQKRQTQATFGLLALALAATLVVGLVGWRLHALTAEAESRRSDAVQARREYDATLEATADGVLGLDLDGRIISLNRAGTDAGGRLGAAPGHVPHPEGARGGTGGEGLGGGRPPPAGRVRAARAVVTPPAGGRAGDPGRRPDLHRHDADPREGGRPPSGRPCA